MVTNANDSQRYPFLPVTKRIPLTEFAPFKLVNRFDPHQDHSMVFDFEHGRYTLVVVNPSQTFRASDGVITVEDQTGQHQMHQAPVEFLQTFYRNHRMPATDSNAPFASGLVGYFSYDFARCFPETHLTATPDANHLADFELFYPDIAIVYDHVTHELILTKAVPSESDGRVIAKQSARLTQLADSIVELMNDGAMPTLPDVAIQTPFHKQFALREFESRVATAKRHIQNGDIFQLILSNPQAASATGSLMAVAQELFTNVPSPYHYFFSHHRFQAVAAAPETLVKKQGAWLLSFPLAGTRRRGRTPLEDEQFATELQQSPKEQAEHNMLVDLGRNDLGRVSQLGSVQVTKLRQLLKFSNVMHLGSEIESQVADDVTPIDIIGATLPAGTLSGAPKQSAMQIINQLEQRKRGIYGGGIGYVDFTGNLDLCIGIRLAYLNNGQLVVHSGAGIVADSDADHEFHEFENKSRLMMDQLQSREVRV